MARDPLWDSRRLASMRIRSPTNTRTHTHIQRHARPHACTIIRAHLHTYTVTQTHSQTQMHNHTHPHMHAHTSTHPHTHTNSQLHSSTPRRSSRPGLIPPEPVDPFSLCTFHRPTLHPFISLLSHVVTLHLLLPFLVDTFPATQSTYTIFIPYLLPLSPIVTLSIVAYTVVATDPQHPTLLCSSPILFHRHLNPILPPPHAITLSLPSGSLTPPHISPPCMYPSFLPRTACCHHVP